MRLQTILTSALLMACANTSQAFVQTAPSELPSQVEKQRALLPEHAVITARLKLSFGDGFEPDAEAVAFTLPPVYADSYNAGLMILGQRGRSGQRILYQETRELGPGGDELILKKVKATGGAEALVLINYHSGAGTVTDWKIISAQAGSLRSLESGPIRNKVLKVRHSEFGGYNGVRVEGDIIAERIPMYSQGTARCCPDRPPIEMRVKFTGKGLKLDSVIELPPDK